MPLDQANGPNDLGLPLFVYGTLLEPLFVERLLEHPVTVDRARLTGYRVTMLTGFNWPVLIPADGEVVEGQVFRDLDAEDLRRLDSYEGVGEGLYRRVGVTVESDASGAEPAWTYLPTERTLNRRA